MGNKKMPMAMQSYFRLRNVESERINFINSMDYQPKFLYPRIFNESTVCNNLETTETGTADNDSLSLVLAAAKLQSDEKVLSDFRNQNEKLFGAPSRTYADAILSRILNKDRDSVDEYRDYLRKVLGDYQQQDELLGPDEKTFKKYYDFFQKYRAITPRRKSLIHILEEELEKSGLAKAGWVVKIKPNASHARTLHKHKQIRVGRDYRPRRLKSAKRIAIHEVYGHALRGPKRSVVESEGFSLVIEQLISKKFMFRRAFRYLAGALGWGVFGEPMNFRQVYEIIWRLMIIWCAYDEEKAKNCAFLECCRVFRGGRPDIAGAVFLKDSVYFSANLKIWDWLSKNDIDYSYFVDIIEGRRSIGL